MKKIKCLVFGLGVVGQKACDYLLSDGYELVGVYGRKTHVGQQLNHVINNIDCDIKVQSSSDFRPNGRIADIALMFTTSGIGDLFDEAARCLQNGINVLTIAEEALFPWHAFPAEAAKLHKIAKDGNATLMGVGINDLLMVQLPAFAALLTNKLRSIRIDCQGNFGRLGPNTLVSMPLGITPSEFAQSESPDENSITVQVADALLSLTGLTSISCKIQTDGIFATGNMLVSSVDQIINSQGLCGFTETVSHKTTEGIDVTVALTGKVFAEGDEEFLQIEVVGDIPIKLQVAPVRSVETTASTAIARIPDIISAQSGLIATDMLGLPHFTRN